MVQNKIFRRGGPLMILALALSACAPTGGVQPWMSGDVKEAWNAGYRGQGARIIVADEHQSGDKFSGNLDGSKDTRRHGGWTALQAGLVAPDAEIVLVDYNADKDAVYASGSGLTVVNNSYGIMSSSSGAGIGSFDTLEQTTINHAQNGTAVIVKAAGNDSVAVDAADGSGQYDVFNQNLVGGQTTIFVGALDKNGTPSRKAALADYSNYAGGDATIQGQFLVVGVDQDNMGGLAGTSFGAPIVSGYAAILGSKFTSATPKQITDQLLGTARTDTIQGYSPSIHGRGEASLSRALAPSSLK